MPTGYESHLTLSASPSAPFWSRRHTSDALAQWGIKLDGLVELLVTELITNALKASGAELDLGWNETNPPVTPSATDSAVLTKPQSYTERTVVPVVRLLLSLDRQAGKLITAVWDKNPAAPQAQHPDLESEGGRGLMLIDALCETWGWYWPTAPVVDGQPWPRSVSPEGVEGTGQYGKIVWARFDLREA